MIVLAFEVMHWIGTYHCFRGKENRTVTQQYCYLLENEVGVSSTDTLDGGEGEHDVPLAVDVRVHHTKDVLEVLRDDQRHLGALRKNLKYN